MVLLRELGFRDSDCWIWIFNVPSAGAAARSSLAVIIAQKISTTASDSLSKRLSKSNSADTPAAIMAGVISISFPGAPAPMDSVRADNDSFIMLVKCIVAGFRTTLASQISCLSRDNVFGSDIDQATRAQNFHQNTDSCVVVKVCDFAGNVNERTFLDAHPIADLPS